MRDRTCTSSFALLLGIVLADGFRQPICYGVEITEYPVVSGQSAGSAEGIGLELVDGQTALK